jgi:type IV pilus assembly protein PilA
MLEKLRARMDRGEEGFTLIELMVVVLIIAILLAIAIPSFLGARGKAQDRAAQSNARNALTAEKTYYTDNQVYTELPADLTAIEPSLTYVAGFAAAQGSKEVGVKKGDVSTGATVTGAVVCVTTASATGTTYVVKDIAAGTNAGTWFKKAAVAACDDSTAGFTDKW